MTEKVTVNVPGGFANLVKGWFFSIDPTNQSSDGYPVTKPASGTYGANPSFPLGTYGPWVWKWDNLGAMVWAAAPPMVVVASTVNGAPGKVIFELSGATGDIGAGNKNFIQSGATGLNTPRVVFYTGWNIQSISDNGSGLIRIGVKTGFMNSAPGTGTVVNITDANANTNANGVWTITKVDPQTFDLQGSTFANTQGVGGLAAFSPGGNQSISMNSSFGSFSGMSNLVVCKLEDEAAIAGGLLVDSKLVSVLQELMGSPGGVPRGSPGWLRFMDVSSVQSSYEGDFATRVPLSYLFYPQSTGRFVPEYWVTGAAGVGDAFTCPNPSFSTSQGLTGAYHDGEVVQFAWPLTYSGGNPTIQLGSRPVVPIFNSALQPLVLLINAGATSAGQDMFFTFSAPWVSPQLNGGNPYVFKYTTVAGDVGAPFTLTGNLTAALSANSVLAAAKMQFGNTGQRGVQIMPQPAQAGFLTVTYDSGPAVCTVVRNASVSVAGTNGTITAGTNTTLVYNYLLGGFIRVGGGLLQSMPYEWIAQLCNQVGANCWYTWGLTKGQFVTDVTTFMAASLNSNLKFGGEPGNEVWNSNAFPYGRWQILGQILSLGTTSSNTAVYSYTALLCVQYSARAKAAWIAAGRSASTYYVFQPHQVTDNGINGNFDTSQLKGANLNFNTNAILAAYGALNGVAGATSPVSTNYAASPNRPVDITTAIGGAPYWGSPWLGWAAGPANGQPGFNNTVAVNAPILEAAHQFGLGNTAVAFAALVGQFGGTVFRNGSGNSGDPLVVAPPATFSFKNNSFLTDETLCASYDSGRAALGMPPLAVMHYEGGPQWGAGANAGNGVNSVNATDINAVAARLVALGWDVSPYTVSGSNNATEWATQFITMEQAWKYDASYKTTIINSYYQLIDTISGANRETRAAQYGFSGPSQWCLGPGDYSAWGPSGNQYQNHAAIVQFNAGPSRVFILKT